VDPGKREGEPLTNLVQRQKDPALAFVGPVAGGEGASVGDQVNLDVARPVELLPVAHQDGNLAPQNRARPSVGAAPAPHLYPQPVQMALNRGDAGLVQLGPDRL